VKWIVFIAAVALAYPAGRWLQRHPWFRMHVWTLVGFLPFFSRLDMALVFFGAERPGDTWGLEVGVLDWLSLSLLLAERGRARPLPYRFALGLYLVVALFSLTQADWTLGAFGYVWRLGRMYLMYSVICRAASDRSVPLALLRGLMFGVLYEGALALWQHYGLGMPRATGTFAHQNTLGIVVNLVMMAPIALVIAGRADKLATLTTIAALPITLFTISRGTILSFAAGVVLVYIGSAFRRWDLRKAKIGLAGLALALVLVPVAVSTLGSRLEGEKVESIRTREQFEDAASLMLKEHPLGVGPNHFTQMLLVGGYGARAGVDWTQRTAIVHNIYLLTAAEMGYPGVIALVILFLSPISSAIRYTLRARQDRRGDLLLGLSVGLATFYIHSFFEWTWRLPEVSYIYWIIVAIAASLARELRDSVPGTATIPVRQRAPGTLEASAVRSGGAFRESTFAQS
jgi:O-antigen ligase